MSVGLTVLACSRSTLQTCGDLDRNSDGAINLWFDSSLGLELDPDVLYGAVDLCRGCNVALRESCLSSVFLSTYHF